MVRQGAGLGDPAAAVRRYRPIRTIDDLRNDGSRSSRRLARRRELCRCRLRRRSGFGRQSLDSLRLCLGRCRLLRRRSLHRLRAGLRRRHAAPRIGRRRGHGFTLRGNRLRDRTMRRRVLDENAVDAEHRREPFRHRDRDARHSCQALGTETAQACAFDVAAAGTGLIGREPPLGRHLELKTPVIDEGAPLAARGSRDLDPRHAHASTVEIEAVHVPAPAKARIRRRARAKLLLLAPSEDLMPLILGWGEQRASADHLAGIRHDEQLASPSRGKGDGAGDEQRQDRAAMFERAHSGMHPKN